MPVKEVCRKHGISSACYYQWKSKYGGLGVSELKRIKELVAENERLKRMYADMAFEHNAAAYRKILRPPEKREAVQYLIEQQALTIHKACRCVGRSRSAWYKPCVDWRARDREIIGALQDLAEDKQEAFNYVKANSLLTENLQKKLRHLN